MNAAMDNLIRLDRLCASFTHFTQISKNNIRGKGTHRVCLVYIINVEKKDS